MKIATHNSATGERGKGLLSCLVTPFSRCQSKSISEQYAAGCRYFDIRVKLHHGKWLCAHGLWTARRSAEDILREIDNFPDRCYVMLTYEGKEHGTFTSFVGEIERRFTWIIITSVNAKKPKWRNICTLHSVPCESQYKILDGSSWHTYLPLPWLWKRIYHNHTEFNNQVFKMVDFL